MFVRTNYYHLARHQFAQTRCPTNLTTLAPRPLLVKTRQKRSVAMIPQYAIILGVGVSDGA